ncbi:hypothetical protein V8F33_004246 [Rhypophila sp. PSN 637]
MVWFAVSCMGPQFWTSLAFAEPCGVKFKLATNIISPGPGPGSIFPPLQIRLIPCWQCRDSFIQGRHDERREGRLSYRRLLSEQVCFVMLDNLDSGTE